jgi:hypothetical protein
VRREKSIENNLDAALIQNKMHDNVKYEVKSAVTPAIIRAPTHIPIIWETVNSDHFPGA